MKISELKKCLQTATRIKNVYLHLPFCKRKCHFCSFPVHAIGAQTNPQESPLFEPNIQRITEEINGIGVTYSQVLESLYIGGGTPSLFSAPQISSLIKRFSIDSNKTEITVQFNETEIERVRQFHQIGVNRLSVGVQTFNSPILLKLNRHLASKNKQFLLKSLIDSPIKNINIDFIYELLPEKKDLEQVKEFIRAVKPAHLTFYMLQVNQGSYLYRNMHKPQFSAFLTGPSDQLHTSQKFIEISTFLQTIGYQHYEVSAFARLDQKIGIQKTPQKTNSNRSKHNSVYWRGDQEFMAFGMGASSLTNNFRITRPSTLQTYYHYVDTLKSKPKQIERQFSKAEVVTETNMVRLQNVIMSRVRSKEGCDIKQILLKYIDTDKIEINEFLQNIKSMIQMEINKELDLVDQKQLKQNDKVRLKIPVGYLYADYIAYRIIEQIEKLVKRSERE